MKKLLKYILLVIAIMAVPAWIYFVPYSGGKEIEKKERIAHEKEQKAKQVITDMISRSNAITGWRKGVVLTSQFQEILSSANGKIAYLNGVFGDVQKTRDNYILYLKDNSLYPTIFYELVMTHEQYKRILNIIPTENAEDGIYIELGVVAAIREVNKLSFSVDANRGEAPDESVVTIDASGIQIRGDVVDFATNDYGFFNDN